EAALHEQEAGLVEPAAVVGREPAVGGQDGAAEVLPRHLLAPDPDLAPLPDRPWLAVLVADLELQDRQRPAGRTEPGPHRRVVALEGRPVVLGAEGGDRRGGFGPPVGSGVP